MPTEYHALARQSVAHANTFAHLHHGEEVEALCALACGCYVLLALNLGPERAREHIQHMIEGEPDHGQPRETGENGAQE